MFEISLKSDRMNNPDYEVKVSQPILGKYIVELLKGGEVVKKFSSYKKRETLKKAQELSESSYPESCVLGS